MDLLVDYSNCAVLTHIESHSNSKKYNLMFEFVCMIRYVTIIHAPLTTFGYFQQQNTLSKNKISFSFSFCWHKTTTTTTTISHSTNASCLKCVNAFIKNRKMANAFEHWQHSFSKQFWDSNNFCCISASMDD